MGFFEEAMRELNFERPKLEPISAAEIGGFEPLKDLKPGERLRFRPSVSRDGKPWAVFRHQVVPEPGEALTVFRVLSIPVAYASGGQRIADQDFTSLFRDTSDGDIVEFPFSSRDFERVED